MTTAVEEMLQRIPPQNLEAEAATLGAMLLERDAITRAVEILGPDDFYRESHRVIFRAILDLFERDEPADMITLGNLLQSRNQLEQVGGTLYLSTIMASAPTAAGIRHYAGIVRDRALQRQLIHAADRIMEQAYLGAQPIEEIVHAAEAAVMTISDRTGADKYAGLKFMRDVVNQATARRRQADADGHTLGFKPSIRALNRMLLPLVPSSLWVIGGEPSRGKSVLAFQFGIEMAEQGASGLIISLEMDEDMIARRMVQARTGMSMFEAEQIRFRQDHEGEVYQGWEQTGDWFREMNLMLLDMPVASPMDILAVGRRARQTMGALDFIVIDYLQLMEADNPADNKDDTRRITVVSRTMKRIAKQLKTGVIFVSSLNRPGQDGENRKPTMSRLRQSGQIEYDVDAALFVHRPNRDVKEDTQVIIDKQRNGPTGIVDLYFNLQYLWFYDQAQESDTSAYERLGGM